MDWIVPSDTRTSLSKGDWLFLTLSCYFHDLGLVITRDETDHEVEYYCYDHFQYPVKLDDDDFNPDKLWRREEKK